MRTRNSKFIVVLGVLALALSACGSNNATLTPLSVRVVTQTPWVIYIPVTTTPEPATVTPLPTAETAKPTSARTPTRPAAPKSTVVPTKPPPTVVAAPPPTAAPACSIGTVVLTTPENGAPRHTRADGSGGDAFIMKWTPPASHNDNGDAQVGYRIDMVSKRGNQVVNGATVYISHNKYTQDGQFVFDQRAVSSLAAGDDAVVTWTVTIVKTTGSFDDQGNVSGNVINCGSPSLPSQINLGV